MKRFAEFLRESKIEQELDASPKEIYSIDLVKGTLVSEGMEDGGDPEFKIPKGKNPFEAIAEASLDDLFGDVLSEGEESGKVTPGWGGEEYVSLDFPGLVSEEKKKEDSRTIKDLTADKERADALGDDPSGDGVDWSREAQKKLEKYSVVDGKLAFRNPESGEMEPVTPEKAEEVVSQKTRENSYKTGTKIYQFDSNGTLLVGKVPPPDSEIPEPDYAPIGRKYRAKFLEALNDKVNADGIHFRWIGDTGGLEVNTTSWITDPEKGDDPRDKDRFQNAEYAPVVDLRNPEWTDKWVQKVLSVVNAKAEAEKSGKKRDNPYGTLEYRDGNFYLRGEPMDETQLKALAVSLNGGFGGETKLLNPNAWKREGKAATAPYWDSYKISVAGSKIGKAINFNLPPVTTCAKGVPCVREGCYAIKAYAAYPSARAAMNCNLALLRKDPGYELFKESMIKALTIPTKAKTKTEKGHKFTMCRFHVNGDLGVRGNDVKAGTQYLAAICEIAAACDDVRFWLYTKQYEILEAYKGSIPPNLCIIVSCWGKFNPFQVTRSQFRAGKLASGLDGDGEYPEEPPSGDESPEKKDKDSGKNFEELAERFPLAYLDDGSEIGEMINRKIQERMGINSEPKVCPCTDSQEIITRCETCKLCFDGSLFGTNLAFRKH